MSYLTHAVGFVRVEVSTAQAGSCSGAQSGHDAGRHGDDDGNGDAGILMLHVFVKM